MRATSIAPITGSTGRDVAADAPETVAGGRPRPGSRWLAAVPLALLGAGAWSHRWVTEDAFINFRVVEMTFAGHPLVFNADERVEAATSALWLAILVVLRAVLGWAADLAWLSLLAGLAFALVGLAA